MMDLETFLTTLHVVIDDFCQSELPPNSQNRGSKHLVQGALHNMCIWLDSQLDQAPLAFAELLVW